MTLHFQVVILEKGDYIIEYKNFGWNEIGPMLKYINFHVTVEKTRKIEITRWNEKGERA